MDPTTSPEETSVQSPQTELRSLVIGHWISQAVRVAAELGVADLLDAGPCSGEELAKACGADPRSLFRLLRALAAVGVFRQLDDDRFDLAPMGAFLRTSAPDSLRAYALVFASERHVQAWTELAHSVATGTTGYEHRFGTRFYDDLARDPGARELFDHAMAGSMARTGRLVAQAYDFSAFATLVDVGGGDATLLSCILADHPRLRAVLFDRPPVAEQARRHLTATSLLGRCEVVAGDFFHAVPDGADAYLLARCLRAFDDDQCLDILTTVRRALPSSGTLLLVERVLPRGEGGRDAKLGDVNMLVLTGGRERSEAEFANLLRAAGFELERIVPTGSAMSVLEASRSAELSTAGTTTGGTRRRDKE